MITIVFICQVILEKTSLLSQLTLLLIMEIQSPILDGITFSQISYFLIYLLFTQIIIMGWNLT